MAIVYCRLEFVQRSKGENACCKSAYFSRSRVEFQGTKFQDRNIYNFSRMGAPDFHRVMLPNHVSEKFKNLEYLWNLAEMSENRKNSQVAMESALGLPRDKIVSFDDNIELVESFVDKHFVSKGLGVQINFHLEDQNNPHCHLLITVRDFDESGEGFSKTKPRDLFASYKKWGVNSGVSWSSEWREHQNDFFVSKGYDLRVDEPGIVSQKHLGPKRMRGQCQSLIEENELRKELNLIESLDPYQILKHVTKHQSVFTYRDVESFILKHVNPERQNFVREEFWNQDEIIQLFTRFHHKEQHIFSTQEILDEERKIFRLANRIRNRKGWINISNDSYHTYSENLNQEQAEAFKKTVFGENLICINGSAGTGKSTLLNSLKDAYEDSGFFVRGLGPDYATAKVLEEKGFKGPENNHRFLFSHKNRKRYIERGREVWIIDEASKISNRSLQELLKIAEKERVKLIFCGDTAQFNPVERGEMFQHFCKQFGSLDLVNIQRQKEHEQREIAKFWAQGDASKAIDMISKNGDFIWNQTKSGAVKDLMRSWAVDRMVYQGSQLIVSYKRDEMQVLNDVAHAFRRKCGELGDKEYLCKTSFGAFLASEGDIIEFRRNDRELNVFNGDQGVLRKVSEKEFVVKMVGEGKPREVVFDPNSYSHYHLGYATTANKSQGGTYDRCYIMHSPQMRLDGFYVLFSRHVERAKCFISKSECENISVLKNLASRAKRLDSTLNYLSQEDIERKNSILNYTQSESFAMRAYGYGLKALSKVDLFHKYSDRKADNSFFNPKVEKGNRGSVKEAPAQYTLPSRIITNRTIIKDDDATGGYKLVEDQVEVNLSEVGSQLYEGFESVNVKELKAGAMGIQRLVEGDNIDVDKLAEELHMEVTSLIEKLPPEKRKPVQKYRHKTPQQKAFKSLDDTKQKILIDYFSKSQKSRELYQVVCSESDMKGIDKRNTSLSSEWRRATAERNESAFTVFNALSSEELEKVFNGDTLRYLKDYAEKHKNYLEAQEKNSPKHIELMLKENVEALCYRLFPEGPSSKRGGELRFRGKGSLKVTISGSYQGTFNDFKNQEKGGMISLVQHAQGLNFSEALRWSREFLGEVNEIKIPSHFSAPSKQSNEGDWVSLIPPQDSEPPSLEKVNKALTRFNNETARYRYVDEKGMLLFYLLRMEPKKGGGKLILPLSFGYTRENPQWKHWDIRGYQSDLKPLYNLEELYRRPEAPVLIVEGEKSADAAQKLMSNYVVITWLGGSNSASKADWKHLQGRDVFLWPDNDEAGFRASEDICKELRQLGVSSLKVVDTELLKKHLPEKWDLADKLPEDLPKSFIKDSILNARESCVSVDSIMKMIDQVSNKPEDRDLKSMVIGLLARVDSRLRPGLEKKHGQKAWEVNNEIAKEVINIVFFKESISQELSKRGVRGEVNERLTSMSLYSKAERGVGLTSGEVENLRKVLKEFGNIPGNKSHAQEFDRSLVSMSFEGKLVLQDRQILRSAFEREVASKKSEALIVQTNAQNQSDREFIVPKQLER